MAKQLAALVSSLQGIDMSPLQNARNTSLAVGGLAEQKRAALARESLEKQRLDLARSNSVDNLQLEKAKLSAAQKQAEEQRALDQELSKAQIAGMFDLKELDGAQELARMNAQAALDEKTRAEVEEYEIAKEERMYNLSGKALIRETMLNASEEQRKYELDKQRGIDPGADATIDRQIRGYQRVIAEKQKNLELKKLDAESGGLEETLQIEKDIRSLKQQELRAKVTKLQRELEESDPENPANQVLKDLQRRLLTANTEQAEEEAEQSKKTTDLQDIALKAAQKEAKKADEGIKAGEDADIGYLSEKDAAEGIVPRGAGKYLTGKETDQRASDERRAESESFGVSDGLSARLEAFKALDNLGDSQDDESIAIRKALRRFLKATRKNAAKDIGISFGSVSRPMFGKAELSDAEMDEIDAALGELGTYEIDLGEDLFG